MRISDWSSDVCSSDLARCAGTTSRTPLPTRQDHDGQARVHRAPSEPPPRASRRRAHLPQVREAVGAAPLEAQPQPRVGAEGEADAVVSPFEDDATPEKRAAVRAFADALPAKRVHVDNNWLQEAMEADIKRHGHRGLGGWQCTCGRFRSDENTSELQS